MLNLPRHLSLTIEHQPQKASYQNAAQYIVEHEERDPEHDEYDAAERELMREADEIWVVQWYPDTPIGSYVVWASTLERALAAASAGSRAPESGEDTLAPEPARYRSEYQVEAMRWYDTDQHREAFTEWFNDNDMGFQTRGPTVVLPFTGDQIAPGEWIVLVDDEFFGATDDEFRATYARVA